jgi:hypothetical protein
MSNRPTPETDAAASPHIGFYSCATVTANFARRLEIERDEAREEAHRFRSLHYSHLGINASASWFPWEEKLGHE